MPWCGSPTSQPWQSPASPSESRTAGRHRHPILWTRPEIRTSFGARPPSVTRRFGTTKRLTPLIPAGAPNDVRISGLVHKIGWRCLPAVLLSLGEAGDCHGWLVGEPHQGISYMFQMMNEARISIGADAVGSASAAYHESLAYAAARPQGRPLTSTDPVSYTH